jgi:hypothetical protein
MNWSFFACSFGMRAGHDRSSACDRDLEIAIARSSAARSLHLRHDADSLSQPRPRSANIGPCDRLRYLDDHRRHRSLGGAGPDFPQTLQSGPTRPFAFAHDRTAERRATATDTAEVIALSIRRRLAGRISHRTLRTFNQTIQRVAELLAVGSRQAPENLIVASLDQSHHFLPAGSAFGRQ